MKCRAFVFISWGCDLQHRRYLQSLAILTHGCGGQDLVCITCRDNKSENGVG